MKWILTLLITGMFFNGYSQGNDYIIEVIHINGKKDTIFASCYRAYQTPEIKLQQEEHHFFGDDIPIVPKLVFYCNESEYGVLAIEVAGYRIIKIITNQ
jgi:hypothetical protein